MGLGPEYNLFNFGADPDKGTIAGCFSSPPLKLRYRTFLDISLGILHGS